METKITKEMVARKLLLPLWNGLDGDYKEMYKMDIWQQFENNLRVAAYTSKLTEFLAKFLRLMRVEIMAKDLKNVESILNSGEDQQILRWLRSETTYLVLQVRLIRQEINDSFKQNEEEQI